ncbi:MAG: YbgA family protein [Acidobacteriia bacterium]|nr:YbgA family protein [Terriglobia bacterium]
MEFAPARTGDSALRVRATARKHANVLFHILGFLKNQIDAEEKAELVASIDDYRKELVPLVVPMTLLLHHLRRYAVPWVLEQTYLNPYPAELMLRNHV